VLVCARTDRLVIFRLCNENNFDFFLREYGFLKDFATCPSIDLLKALPQISVKTVAVVAKHFVAPLIDMVAEQLKSTEKSFATVPDIVLKAEAWTRLLSIDRLPVKEQYSIPHQIETTVKIILDLGFAFDPNLKFHGSPILFLQPTRYKELQEMGRLIGKPLDLMATDDQGRDVFSHYNGRPSQATLIVAASGYALFEKHYQQVLRGILSLHDEELNSIVKELLQFVDQFRLNHLDKLKAFAKQQLTDGSFLMPYGSLNERLEMLRSFFGPDRTAYFEALQSALRPNDTRTVRECNLALYPT